jgi:hypothetical protein
VKNQCNNYQRADTKRESRGKQPQKSSIPPGLFNLGRKREIKEKLDVTLALQPNPRAVPGPQHVGASNASHPTKTQPEKHRTMKNRSGV